jgi:hypothetical protein
MSDDNKPIQFPGNPQATVPDAQTQGFAEFHEHMQGLIAAAFAAVTPYQGKHPAIDQCLGEVLRYAELTSMYMDRIHMYVNNPHLLQKLKETPDAPSSQE